MKVKTFFYLALLIPIVGALLSVPLSFLADIFSFPIAAIYYGGIPYGLLAILLAFAIRKCDALWKLHTLAWLSPILYLPFLAVYLPVHSFVETGNFPNVMDVCPFVLTMWIFAVVLGYAYVVIFAVIYLLAPLSDLAHYKSDHNKGFNRTPVSAAAAKPGELNGGAG